MEKGLRAAKTLAGARQVRMPPRSYPLCKSETPRQTEKTRLFLHKMPETLHIISPKIGRPLQSHLIVQHDMDRHPVRKLMHPPIVVKIPFPIIRLQQRQDLRRDAAGKEKTAGGHQLQHKA